MKYLFATYLGLIFLVSCENKSDNNEQLAAPSVSSTTIPIVPVSTDTSGILNNNAGVALNPQHGEPGHRCDIAVGAPLNTPAISSSIQPMATPTATPSLTTTIAPTITPANETKKATPNPNTAAVTLNPKHGEPGHRCDIAVGAPLTSKPTQ